MSIASSLVLLLLCFSFHASCNARSFGVVQKETERASDQHSVSKKNEKLNNPARVSIQPDARKSSISNGNDEDAKEVRRFEKEKANKESNKHIPAMKENIPVEVSGMTMQMETRASHVAWRVPHKKRGDQEPGFNLDYLPPKTHPPVHN